MAREGTPARSAVAGLIPHLKGHAFLFDGRPAPAYDSSTGTRLLLIFLVLEVILGPRLWLVSLIGQPGPPYWLRVSALLVLALVLIRYFARLKLSQLGLRGWREWSTTERSYFLQVLFIANVFFALIFAGRLWRIAGEPSGWGHVGVVLLTYFVWGFYQELMYRGILQKELVRRWGVLPGILASNLVYTFGPLHFYHFSGASVWQALPMFAGIFSIGLFFAILMQRSGNLTMVGIFHGLGDSYITGLGTLGL
ncbi:MAG TPA: CPBP family intramembrane glutamic endopeptidase [Candidatus Polarisedimenticolia bacterium]|nr:CPBP family intramembrane glutamic endopeptidase [Candidatus Polarisedimenticolia bacterium]